MRQITATMVPVHDLVINVDGQLYSYLPLHVVLDCLELQVQNKVCLRQNCSVSVQGRAEQLWVFEGDMYTC